MLDSFGMTLIMYVLLKKQFDLGIDSITSQCILLSQSGIFLNN